MAQTINMFGGMPPDIAAQQQELAQQQLLANTLAQRSGGPDMTGWNSMRTVPKLSGWAASVSQLSPIVAAMMQSSVLKKQMDLQREVYQRGQYELAQYQNGVNSQPTQPPPAAAVAPSPNFSPSDPSPEAAIGQSPASGTGFSSAAVTPEAPPAPKKMSYEEALAHLLMASRYGAIPESLVQPALKPIEPTDTERLARLAGMDPSAAAAGKLSKDSFSDVRPGGTGINWMTGRSFVAPIPGENTQFSGDPLRGGITASGISGLPEARADLTGQTELARTNNSLHPVTDELGHTTPVLGSDIVRGVYKAPNRFGPPSGSAGGSGGSNNDKFSDAPVYRFPNSVYITDAQKQEANDVVKAKNAGLDESRTAIKAGQKHTYDVGNLADSFGKAFMGPGSDLKASLGKFGNFLGLNSEDLNRKISATEVADKLGVVFGTEASKAELGPGQRLTQSEWSTLLNRGAPNHRLLPYAAADVLTLRETMNRYDTQRARDMSQYLLSGHDPRAFEDYYAEKNPVSRFASENAPKIQAEIYKRMGLKNDNPSQAPSVPVGTKKTIGGKSYVRKTDGWYEE